MTTLSNIVILTSLPFPISCQKHVRSQNNCVKNRGIRFQPCTLLNSISYHLTERKFEKMLLSNRKIKEANDDNKKTMAVKMVFDEWLLQSICAVRASEWVSDAARTFIERFRWSKSRVACVYVYIQCGDNEVSRAQLHQSMQRTNEKHQKGVGGGMVATRRWLDILYIFVCVRLHLP